MNLPSLPELPWGIAFERPELLLVGLLALPMAAVIPFSRRKLTSFRLVVALAVRLGLLFVLALALAGLTWKEEVDELAVVFVVDKSASIGAGGEKKAQDFITEALKSQGPNDVAGVVVFGADAALETSPRENLEFHGIESIVSPHQSDLASGIRLASAVLPSDRARRVIVLSDGEETRGDAATQVMLTAGKDLEVAVVPLGQTRGTEVVVEDLLAPARVDEGAPFDVRVIVRSDLPAKGKLRLYRNEQFLGDIPVDLEGGRSQVIPVRQQADGSGLYRYKAVLEVEGSGVDTLTQNNEAMGTVQVTGRPRVLYAEGEPDQASHLATVLRAEGLDVDVVGAADVPSGPAGLRPYQAVILSDIPAYALTTRQEEALHAYVRDMGRGLIMLGGDESFGLGGYYGSPIEDALPVNMDLEDKSRFPKMAMVHAIDKSCSMGDGGGSPLDLAKQAAVVTVELLNERDSLGVIGFDDTASWVVPLGPLTDKNGVTSVIRSMRTGGGTDILPAVVRANQALDANDAAIKHVIVLSDGVTAGGDFQGVIMAAKAKGITLSALAIGQGADRTTMQSLAQWGGGSFYLVTDPTAIPAIFTRETLLASRSFLVEEDFVPVTKEPSELIRGVTGDGMAPLHGYVATEAKPRATVALEVPGEHPAPLLVHWHYGLGRSVAWTSDTKARWAKDWVGTEDYTRLWAQTLRWTIGDPTAGALQVDAEIADGELQVTVDAFDTTGGFRNFLAGEARVIAPDLTVHPLDLQQVAPGRYRASMPVDADGSWLVGVSMKDGDTVVGQTVAEAVQPYSPEYRVGGAGRGLLAELGTVGGGGVLTDPAAVFKRPEVPREVPHPIWPPLLALAACLLILDIALRRLAMLPGKGSTNYSLVRQTAATSRPLVTPTKSSFKTAQPGVAPMDLPEEPTPAPEPEVEAAPKPPDDSYAGRLLAARKSARKKMDGDP